uniref:TNF superfamily member 10, like n=1 Tax=Gadus morhua TaxID=8049 RepID=A0A8C5B969_GADMO
LQLQQQQDYFRSVSNESTTYMMVPAAGQRDRDRREAPSKMWVAMVVIVVVVLQIASTTGLFVYLNMSISQVRPAIFNLETGSLLNGTLILPWETCLCFCCGKKWNSMTTETMQKAQVLTQQQINTHIQNTNVPNCTHDSHVTMTIGFVFLWLPVYFRYPSPAAIDGDQRSVSHQLVQCVYKKTSYPSPIQLLKGVGTKCWAPDAEYALHSVYQGGLFELRAGDELFVSYFGAFRLDL